jgi:signal transduction histidine kinase/ActR/RegA family two-component response regulator
VINSGRQSDRRATRHERRETHHERREALLARLAEAEQTLQALREGEVDALVLRGPGGDRIYTLQGAEEPYRNLVEQMRQGAVVLAESGDILYSNARFAGLVGEPLESIVGGHIGRFIAEADRVAFTTLLNSGNGTCRSRIVSSAAEIIEVHLSLTTTVSSKGLGSLCLIVADLRALLEARGERDRAERDSHTKNEFLAMLAHELRNPLGAIHSAVGLLESVDPKSGPAIRAREVIARQVGHLSHLIDDLLDVERVVSGKIRLDRHPLDMAEAVRHAVAAFTGNAALDRRIEIRTEPMWVEGDAGRLEQVFANIVTNAVKYTPPGGEIRVSVRSEGDDAVFSVEDTGFGIAPELLPSIFDMFVQGERTLDRAQGGLGIGLTLVRRLIDLHGGSVTASSGGVGNGSTFTVRLPRVANAATPPVSVSFVGTTPKRVLLIEDSRDAREMFRMMLEAAGHSVYEADNGYRGLEVLEREHLDVAIIDIGLPGLDGYQVARHIRGHPNGRSMLLLALTGYASPRDHERSVEAGFDHHLVKPVDTAELARLLDERVARCPETQA